MFLGAFILWRDVYALSIVDFSVVQLTGVYIAKIT